MTTLRREDDTNRRIALAFLGSSDYPRAIGYAYLLLDDAERKDLLRGIAKALPAAPRAELERRMAGDAKQEQRAANRRKWGGSPSGTQRRAKDKSGAAVASAIEPSEALAGDPGRLLARKMKYEKGSV